MARFGVTILLASCIPLLSLLVEAFVCQDTSDGRLLVADMAIDCDNSTHTVAQLVSGLAIAVMAGGVVGTGAWMWWLRKNDELLTSSSGRRLAALYEPFKPSFPYMELFTLVVKAWVVVCGVFTSSGTYNSIACLPVVSVYSFIVLKYRPWYDHPLRLGCVTIADAMNKFGRAGAVAAVAALLVGLLHDLVDTNWTRDVQLVVGTASSALVVVFTAAWAQAAVRGTAEVASTLIAEDAAWNEWRATIQKLILQHECVRMPPGLDTLATHT